jgi:DNA-binding LacI/PurR family transcriptional regulator
LRIPEDLSVVGFDNISHTEMVTPTLTTIAQPTYQMGRQAAELLIAGIKNGANDIKGPRHLVLFSPELIVRDSGAVSQGTVA